MTLPELLARCDVTPTGCLEWSGARWPTGYGAVRAFGRTMRAHRLALELASGERPRGQVAMHSCHNRACCNPTHLTWGTQRTNLKTSRAVGRMPPPRGPGHPNAKLTTAEVQNIRTSFLTNKELARNLDIDPSVVSRIRRGLARTTG